MTASLTEGIRVRAPAAAGFSAELHLVTWLRAAVDVPVGGDASDNFSIPIARPVLAVGALDGLFRLFLQPELAGTNVRLLDLSVDFAPHPAFQLRIGQFITPYSRAFITPLPRLGMSDFGIVSDTFRADRDLGVMAFGRIAGVVEYDIGVFNGSGITGTIGDTPLPMVMWRMVLTPYGAVPYDQAPSLDGASPHGLAIGVGGFLRERSTGASDGPRGIQSTASLGADVSVVEGPWTLFVEGYLREEVGQPGPYTESLGVFAQTGLFVVPRILSLNARAGFIEPDLALRGADLVSSYEGSVKGHLVIDDVAYGHHLSIALQYRYVDAPEPFGAFTSSSHRVIAQVQLWM